MSLLDRTEALEARVRAVEAKLMAEFPPAVEGPPAAAHLPGQPGEDDEPVKRGKR